MTPNPTSRAKHEQSGCALESYSDIGESTSKPTTSQRSSKPALQPQNCCSLRTGVTSAVDEGLATRCANLQISFPLCTSSCVPPNPHPVWCPHGAGLHSVQRVCSLTWDSLILTSPSSKTALGSLSVKPAVRIETKVGFVADSPVLNLVCYYTTLMLKSLKLLG